MGAPLRTPPPTSHTHVTCSPPRTAPPWSLPPPPPAPLSTQCYTFLGFITGMAPPGYILNMTGAGNHLLNILRAHTATYHALKALPGGETASIGLVHHHISFLARSTGPLYFLAA